MRTNVYIDSFNLYYGCLKGTPHRWLDLDALCRRLLPRNQINRIRFFTARVKDRPHDPQQSARQDTYFRALRTIPHLEIHEGNFLTAVTSMPLAVPPPTGPKTVRVIKTEEKGSDVNLATYLLLDGFQGDYEVAVVMSGDTDLVEPIAVVQKHLNLRVGVLNPHPRRSAELAKVATFYKPIGRKVLPRCQFSNPLTDHQGTFHKPAGW
ncbi:MAG: NYN domain-containing protein [Dehalococcoidia bacterium]